MRTTINHAIDLLLQSEKDSQSESELVRIVRRVQEDFLEIIENALSLLVQDKSVECDTYLRDERQKLIQTKDRVGELIADDGRWESEFHRLVIEYLFTRARLVDEIRQFPNFALERLERLTLDESLGESIIFLEEAMTGKKDLFARLIEAGPR
jgi:hypothetical protein